MKSGILVSSETDEGAFELLTKAREISKQLDWELSAVILGDRDDGTVQSYFEHGALKTLLIPSSSLGTLDAETYALALYEITKETGPDVLLIRSTRLGKETAGRVAQKLKAGCITDAIGLTLQGQDLVVDRYALGGNTISS